MLFFVDMKLKRQSQHRSVSFANARTSPGCLVIITSGTLSSPKISCLFFTVAGQAYQCWSVSASSWHLEHVSFLDSSSRCWYALSSSQCPDPSWANRAASFLVWIFTSSSLDKCSYVFDTVGCVGGRSLISLWMIALAACCRRVGIRQPLRFEQFP